MAAVAPSVIGSTAEADLMCDKVLEILQSLRFHQRDDTQRDAVPEPPKAPDLTVALDDATIDTLAERIAVRLRTGVA